MWRIGIASLAGIALAAGAIAGGGLKSDVGVSRSQPVEVAARQAPAVASDVEAAAGVIGGKDRVALAQSMHDQLRRELFGAAAGSQPRQANGATTGEAPTATRGAGATGDIPASMSASLPPMDDRAAAGTSAPASVAPPAAQPPPAQTPAATPPQRVSPAPPRPAAAAKPTPPPTARAAQSTRSAAPAAAKGRGGDAKVAEAQRLLAILGYAPGVADGRAGRQTTAALEAYQKDAGLPVDGRIDGAVLARLRKDMRSPVSAAKPAPSMAAKQPASLTERILGGMQRLIGRDLDSVQAPRQLAEYCASRADEWIYDRGQDRLRHCGEINGSGRIAYRPLPGDR